MRTDPLPPSAYPWAEPSRTGVLRPDGFVEGALRGDFLGRVPVVAVGSNAAPTVLRRKLDGLLESGLPMGSAIIDGLHIGHSAHVSARGYVAAAPARGGAEQPVTVCWFDTAQLAVLDETEPNYRRIRLPESMPCRLDALGADVSPAVTQAEVYESIHGVLGEHGAPLALLDQASVLSWLADRLAGLRGSLEPESLADAATRERVRVAMMAAELVLPSGLRPSDR